MLRLVVAPREQQRTVPREADLPDISFSHIVSNKAIKVEAVVTPQRSLYDKDICGKPVVC